MPIDFATAEPNDDPPQDAHLPAARSPDALSLPLASPAHAPSDVRGVVRWQILTLVFLATAINYLDRGVMGILAPQLQDRYHISDKGYGIINAAFALVYACGQLGAGPFLEEVGLRAGYAISLTAWSVSSMLHALFHSTIGFGFARGLLGLSESPNYPAAVKTLADWFPRRERAFAMGIVNAGANVGSVATPAIVPFLALTLGWQSAFIATGLIGLIWVVCWVPLYRQPAEHPQLSAAELAWINSDPPEPPARIPWLSLLTHRQTWAFMVGKFLSDPFWLFYMGWLATFFNKRFQLDLAHVGLPLFVVMSMAVIGSIAGGWFSSSLLRIGWSVNAARKTAMLISALGVVPIMFAGVVTHLWAAVALVGLAVGCHQAWSTNLYTLCSDMFPRRAVGSVAGIGGTCGYLGATLFSIFTGYLLTWTHQKYSILFIIAGSAYLLAFVIIQLLAPTLAPVQGVAETEARGAFPMHESRVSR